MSNSLVSLGVNVVGVLKEKKAFMMTCAWMTQVGYDQLICLIGEQSQTGKILKIGDMIGVSSLTKDQKEIASFIGENHSLEVNKCNDCVTNENSALLIKDARVNMICQVVKIIHLEGIEEDNLVYLKVLKVTTNNDLPFLTMDDFE